VSLGALWRFLVVALPVLSALLATLQSVDLTYHIRAGQEILTSGSVPTIDTWTFTANGQAWLDQQWGAQVVLALIERVAGWTGLAVARALLVGLIFGTLALILRRRGLSDRTTSLLVLAAFIVAAPALALRPQLLGMACFAIVLWLVSSRREHPHRLWAVPLLTIVWANLHGSFFLGPVVLGLAWLEDLHDGVPQPHRVLLVAALATLGACLTPVGPWVWVYTLGLSTNPEVTSRITEWQATSVRDASGVLFFVSAAAVVAVLARRGRPVPWPTLLWLLVFFVLGAYAIRGLAWWPLAAVVAVSGLLAPPAVQVPARQDPVLMRRLNIGIAAILIAAAVALLPIWRPVDPGLQAPAGVVGNAPSGITAALREIVRPGSRIFNPQPWGSWFEYSLPAALVALDSRIELFPADVWDQYEAVVGNRTGWQRQLDDWGVTIFVAEPGWTETIATLDREGWSIHFADSDGTVLTRD
jgi:hypothetical protein